MFIVSFNIFYIEIKNEEKEDQMSAKLFHKAVKYFTTYFQYMIEEVHSGEDDYTVKITFIIEGKLSKHPIHFIFDSKIDTLISEFFSKFYWHTCN